MFKKGIILVVFIVLIIIPIIYFTSNKLDNENVNNNEVEENNNLKEETNDDLDLDVSKEENDEVENEDVNTEELNKEEVKVDKAENSSSKENDASSSSNKDKEDVVILQILDVIMSYEGDYLNVGFFVDRFNQNSNHKDKLLNLTVDNIVLDGKYYTFKLVNHPQSCTEISGSYLSTYNNFYINDKMIYAQNDQVCYLERIYLITVIDNKYLGVSFQGQAGNYMKIYNSDIELVDTIKFIDIEISNGKIIYTQYQEDNGCILNRYSYEIIDGVPNSTLIESVPNTSCNQLTGEGCCN